MRKFLRYIWKYFYPDLVQSSMSEFQSECNFAKLSITLTPFDTQEGQTAMRRSITPVQWSKIKDILDNGN